MRTNFTPWARSALGYDAMERLRWHLARGLTLDVSADGSPYRFWVRLFRPDGSKVVEVRNVIRGSLFETICTLLIEAGEPLPTEIEFQRMKALA